MSKGRIEVDSMGPITVPAGALWGAQTQRSLKYFNVGTQKMPIALVHAMARIKCVAALVNERLGLLDAIRAQAIADAALQVAAGLHDDQFPLSLWQTGSGTHSHMNVNEVVANLASIALWGGVDGNLRVSAHDEVNRGQSTNDVFPSAMHLALAMRAQALVDSLNQLRASLGRQSVRYKDTYKVGRTHLQDAAPVTLGQEFATFDAQLQCSAHMLAHASHSLHELPLGGTAVGTGQNAAPDFGRLAVEALADSTGLPFVVAHNRMAATSGHEALVVLHSAYRVLAVTLTKLGNDLRMMASGPRAGLGEIELPPNEPGSSMMPGKVNPSQIEALLMICHQVMAHDHVVALAASQGQFELNTCKPLIAHAVLDSQQMLTDVMSNMARFCIDGMKADTQRLASQLKGSWVGATALSAHIGYMRAAAIADWARRQGCTLREAALQHGGVAGDDFDRWTWVGEGPVTE